MKFLTFKVPILNRKLVLEEGKITTEMTLVITPDVQYTGDTWQSGVLTGTAEDMRASESLTKVDMYKLPLEGE